MEGELTKFGLGGLIAYIALKEAFGLVRELIGWKRNGNGNGNGNGHDPAIRGILGWLTTKGCDIHTASQRTAASVGALLDINQQHLEAQQEHTREQRRQHAALLNAFAKEQ